MKLNNALQKSAIALMWVNCCCYYCRPVVCPALSAVSPAAVLTKYWTQVSASILALTGSRARTRPAPPPRTVGGGGRRTSNRCCTVGNGRVP